jgi:hypothetical protein
MDARNDKTGRDAGAAPNAGAGCPGRSDQDPSGGPDDRQDDLLDEEDAREESWDADDERRRRDCFAPPREPCECYCLHCGRVFMSDGIWFQRVVGARDGFEGFWMCPTPNCGGSGFTFDIFPTDPDHPANEGWTYCDDEEEEGEEGEAGEAAGQREWDPEEPEYKALDEAHDGDFDDDIEGEEWKYGLKPGERPPEPKWAEEARREWEEEQKQYDGPDLRPRELDWSNREDERRPAADDDIPF